MVHFYAIVALVAFLAGASSYPTGAPKEACESLNPTSHGKSTATGPPPYELTFSSSNYQPSQKIQVTLAGSDKFKGFLIEGRSKKAENETGPVGFFSDTTTAKIVCDLGKDGNGITHRNNTVKSSEVFTWQAPDSNMGDVTFHFTVVRGGAPSTKGDAADYFMNINSSPLPAASVVPFTKMNIV